MMVINSTLGTWRNILYITVFSQGKFEPISLLLVNCWFIKLKLEATCSNMSQLKTDVYKLWTTCCTNSCYKDSCSFRGWYTLNYLSTVLVTFFRSKRDFLKTAGLLNDLSSFENSKSKSYCPFYLIFKIYIIIILQFDKMAFNNVKDELLFVNKPLSLLKSSVNPDGFIPNFVLWT